MTFYMQKIDSNNAYHIRATSNRKHFGMNHLGIEALKKERKRGRYRWDSIIDFLPRISFTAKMIILQSVVFLDGICALGYHIS